MTGGADIACAAAAAATAGQALDILGQAGGTAATDAVGKNGGAITITSGAGSAKNGAGATDGDGADLVFLAGAKGGATAGTEVDGIVRVGSPTVGSTKATNVLAVGGAFEVDGISRLDGDVNFFAATPTIALTNTEILLITDQTNTLMSIADTGTTGTLTISGTSTLNGVTVRNSATGNVVLDFRDYADSADDDMAHAEIIVNLTDATTGAEDADFSIGVVEAGAAADVRFLINADAGVTIGSASNTAVTLSTTGTGDATVVAPVDSISTGEILDGTLVAADLADTLCLQIFSVEFNPTEASATDDYASLVGINVATGLALFGATETSVDQFLVPVGVNIDNLRVDVATAPGAGNDPWTITIRDDAASTTLTCTVDETATTCNDAVAPVVVAANSRLDVLVSSAGGDADPTATALITVSFCITQ